MSSSSVEHRHGIGGTSTAAKRILLFPFSNQYKYVPNVQASDGYKLYLKNCYKCVNTLASFFARGNCPVQTKISDKRVVKIYNAAIILTTVVAGLFFVFAWKSWAITTPVVVGTNMWMDSSSIADSSDPKYCNNANYDYIYSDSWKYTSASCSKPDIDKVFLKGPGMPGSFWVSTFFSHKLHQIEKCHNSHMNLSCSGGDWAFQIELHRMSMCTESKATFYLHSSLF